MVGRPSPSAAHRDSVRRLGWGVADQALSSLTNFSLGLLAARYTTPLEFGAFSIVFTTYFLALGIARAIASEPMTVRYSDVATSAWRDGASRSAATAFAGGAGCGVALVLTSFIVAGRLGESLFFLGLLLPMLMMQDSWRFAFFAAGRGRDAFLNDLVWALALIPAMVLVIAWTPTASHLIVGWGGAATVAALFGSIQARTLPRVAHVKRWFVEHRSLIPRFVIENAALNGASHIVMFGVGALAGLTAAGSVRGATLLLGPFFVLFTAVNLVAIPEGVRLLRRSVRTLQRFAMLLSGGLVVGALAWGSLVYLLPSSVGTALLGPTWPGARQALFAVSAWAASSGLITGPFIGLRALGAARRSLHARLVTASLVVVGGLAGAALGGGTAAAAGVAAGQAVGFLDWWVQLKRAVAAYDVSASEKTATPTFLDVPGAVHPIADA